ncbi:MAG: hypothetical protein ACI9VR_002798 [Cognaticolwellia sp.]|jgi:hypothetical protein
MLLLLLACSGSGSVVLGDSLDTGDILVDQDGDGFGVERDCDDSDPEINPDADELCDGVDNNCSGSIDDDPVDAERYFEDADQDGYGVGQGERFCDAPQGAADQGGDCDDERAGINPSKVESCDANDRDQDCNGLSDDQDPGVNPETYNTFYIDQDGDGLGDPENPVYTCDRQTGSVNNLDDCDDTDPEILEECPVDGWDGTYAGGFQLDVVITDFGVTDTCSGEGRITVDGAGGPQIQGEIYCSFGGTLAGVLGEQDATIQGRFLDSDSARGQIDVGGIFQDTWDGEFYNDALSGEFDGETTVSGYDVQYSGFFQFERE